MKRHEDDEHHEDEEADDHHEEHEHGHGEFDPHVWMDPTPVAGWTVEIAEALAEVDPDHAAEYATCARPRSIR